MFFSNLKQTLGFQIEVKILHLNPKSTDDFLEILFYNKNQVDHKITLGLGREFLCILSRFVY